MNSLDLGGLLVANQYTDGWTTEQIDILKSCVGKLTFDKIAKKVGKTPEAVESKLDKLGLANTKIASGLVTVHELAVTLKVDDKTVRRWIENRGLPAEKKNLRYGNKNGTKRLFTYISIEDFWKWASKHKDLINWYKLERNVLIPEPDWVEKRRKLDYYKKPARKPWTPQADRKLWKLYYVDGLPQKEIAILMDRTLNSIERRLKRLREMGYGKTFSTQPIFSLKQSIMSI